MKIAFGFVIPGLQVAMVIFQFYVVWKTVLRYKAMDKLDEETDRNLTASRKLLLELASDYDDQRNLH